MSDADELHALIEANRAHLAQWMPWAGKQAPEDTRAFLERACAQADRNDGFQAAVLANGSIQGVVGLHGIDPDKRSTSLGYWLSEQAQGSGTMTKAVKAIMDLALRDRGLNRVEVRIDTENNRSRRLIERVGFQLEGVARQANVLHGKPRDEAVYSMLACEWNDA